MYAALFTAIALVDSVLAFLPYKKKVFVFCRR